MKKFMLTLFVVLSCALSTTYLASCFSTSNVKKSQKVDIYQGTQYYQVDGDIQWSNSYSKITESLFSINDLNDFCFYYSSPNNTDAFWYEKTNQGKNVLYVIQEPKSENLEIQKSIQLRWGPKTIVDAYTGLSFILVTSDNELPSIVLEKYELGRNGMEYRLKARGSEK